MEFINNKPPKVSFAREMLHNKFLLLTVFLAASAAVYLCVGLFMLLSH